MEIRHVEILSCPTNLTDEVKWWDLNHINQDNNNTITKTNTIRTQNNYLHTSTTCFSVKEEAKQI